MKLSRKQLTYLIERSLLIETSTSEFVKSGLDQALKSNKISEEVVDNIVSGVAAVDSLGEITLYEKIATHPKGQRLVVRLGILATPATATALSLFGIFTFVGGIFYVLPGMISATINSLNTIPGNVLNYYKIKNGPAILRGQEQKPITWEEFGTASGPFGDISRNFTIDIGTKHDLATVLAASKIMKGTPDIMKKIEDIGIKKFGQRSWYQSGAYNKEGYTQIFDTSFYNAIEKRKKELVNAGSLRTLILDKVRRAAEAEDISTLKVFGELAASVFL